MNDAQKKWQEIKQKYEELAELEGKLDCSLSIQALWPDAFGYGRAHSRFDGNLSDPSSMRFVIEDGNGNTKEFPLDQVPILLLHRQIGMQLKRCTDVHMEYPWQQLKERYIYKRLRDKEVR